jgi:DNA-binding MarR family transcriptional regulator
MANFLLEDIGGAGWHSYMHLHGIVKIDAAAFIAVQCADNMDPAMKRKPSNEVTAAWIRLMRVQSRVLGCVEQDLKKAGFPPLAWYDALLELSRAPSGELRPVELEKQMLIPQYSTSRLIDRLVDEGLAARRECKIDKRGQFVEITEAGRELQKKMWNSYSAAIEKYVGSKLSDADALRLCGLLDRLGCSCDEVAGPPARDVASVR